MALAADIRQSVRVWARSPGLTTTLILTVAVGTGGTAAIFGFVGGLVTHGLAGLDTADAIQFQKVATLLFCASALVLLLACSTVAGLLLSRASARMMETAVKVALGATRARLARLCLIDSLVITLAGGAIGVLFAWWTTKLFPMLFFSEDAEQLSLAPNIGWLAAAGAVWIIAMLASGMVPVLTVNQRDPSSVLRRDASKTSNASRHFRNRLVVSQIAACCVLIVLAGVIREDLHATLRTARGRALESLLFVRVRASAEAQRDLQAAATKIAGVTGTAWIRTLPGGQPPVQTFKIERPVKNWKEIRLDVATFAPDEFKRDLRAEAGRLFGGRDAANGCRVAVVNDNAAGRDFSGDPIGRVLETAAGEKIQIVGMVPETPRTTSPTLFLYGEQPPLADGEGPARAFVMRRLEAGRDEVTFETNIISPEYSEVFVDPAIAGRSVTDADRPGRCRTAVISEDGAAAFFGGQAIEGALIDPGGDRLDIVGVVRRESLGAGEKDRAPMLFTPLAQTPQPVMTLAIRASAQTATFRAALSTALSKVAGAEMLTPIGTFEEYLERTSLAAERIATNLVAVSALMALALSVAGVYAVMSDLVVRRRRELALRIALGAGSWRLVGNIAREGLRMAGLGGLAGLGVALVTMPLLNHAGVSVTLRLPGPFVIVSAVLSIAFLVAIACALPAWRAVSVDPRMVMHDG